MSCFHGYDYSRITTLKQLRDACDSSESVFEVKDMANMTFDELRMVLKYIDLIHDHCDIKYEKGKLVRSTLSNCGKNRYHPIPDELHGLILPSGAVGGAVEPKDINVIQFLNAIHNYDKVLNTNNIEQSFTALLSSAFPREFGGNTVFIGSGDSEEQKNLKAGETRRREGVLHHVYNSSTETIPAITLDTLLSGTYNIETLSDNNTLQISLDHSLIPTQLSRVGNFVRAYFGTHNGGSPDTRYNVFCDSSPSILKFMKPAVLDSLDAPDASADNVPFTQIYSAQTVLDSATSGRDALSREPVGLYTGNGNEAGITHTYTKYGLTNITSGLVEELRRGIIPLRPSQVATISTFATRSGGADIIEVTTILNNIGVNEPIKEILYIGGVIPHGKVTISSGPNLPYIAKLHDNVINLRDRDITRESIKEAIRKACDNCNSTMWKMESTLTTFVERYKAARVSDEKLKIDILDYINDWKGFGDAEMVVAAAKYPETAGVKNMFVTGDLLSALFGRFENLPTVISNSSHQHILYRPVKTQTHGARVLSELRLVSERLQRHYNIVNNYIKHNVYKNKLIEFKNATDSTHPSYILRDSNLPVYTRIPLSYKLEDLHTYVSGILNAISDFSIHYGEIPLISGLTATSQLIFNKLMAPAEALYRTFDDATRVNLPVYTISTNVLNAYATLLPDRSDHIEELKRHTIIPPFLVDIRTGLIVERLSGRKRTASQTELEFYPISIPDLVELLKVYLEHIGTIIPPLQDLTNKLEKITSLEIFNQTDKNFLHIVQKLNTQIKKNNYLQLNVQLKISPIEYTKITLEHDTILKNPINENTITHTHPFINALSAVKKTFLLDENRTRYKAFIEQIAQNIITSISVLVEDIIQSNPLLRQGSSRMNSIINETIKSQFNTILTHAFGVSGGSKLPVAIQSNNGNETMARPIGDSPAGSITTVSSRGGSRRQAINAFAVLNELICDFYDIHIFESLLPQTISTYGVIKFGVNIIEDVPVISNEDTLDTRNTTMLAPSYADFTTLENYTTSVFRRVGFSPDSYVIPDELTDMCRPVFEAPIVAPSGDDDVALPPQLDAHPNESMTERVAEPQGLMSESPEPRVTAARPQGLMAETPEQVPQPQPQGASPLNEGSSSGPGTMYETPPLVGFKRRREWNEEDEENNDNYIENAEENSVNNMTEHPVINVRKRIPNTKKRKTRENTNITIVPGIPSLLGFGGATRMQKKRRLRARHIKTQRAK